MTVVLGSGGQNFKLQSVPESSQKAEHGNKQNRKIVAKLAVIEYEKIFSYSVMSTDRNKCFQFLT